MCGAVWSSCAHHFDKNLYCASCLEREAVCGKGMSDLKVTLYVCVCVHMRAGTHTSQSQWLITSFFVFETVSLTVYGSHRFIKTRVMSSRDPPAHAS